MNQEARRNGLNSKPSQIENWAELLGELGVADDLRYP